MDANSNSAVDTRYLHTDHLGSITAIVSGSGVERLSYDAFGNRRDDDWVGTAAAVSEERGYTGHEHLDDVGLIHMNGRIYDPQLGRMASADPVLKSPMNAQNYNRYSSVLGNPLKYTDPSGYCRRPVSSQWASASTAAFNVPFFTNTGYAGDLNLEGNVYLNFKGFGDALGAVDTVRISGCADSSENGFLGNGTAPGQEGNSNPSGYGVFRPEGHDYPFGRPLTIVPPGSPQGKLMEDYFPFMHTTAVIHDGWVKSLTGDGMSDLLANWPTMPFAFIYSASIEAVNFQVEILNFIPGVNIPILFIHTDPGN